MAYTFDQVFAADPANPSNVAQNASITIFEPGDGTMTPLTITDPDGQPLGNPITVNANGFASAFAHATLDRVSWQGGGFTGFFTSYDGMKNEAVAARAAAETAASTAGADAAAVADAALSSAVANTAASATSAADSASSAIAAAAAAANSASLVGAPADTAIAAAINGAGTATHTLLNTTYAKPLKNTVILFGTSLEAQNKDGADTLDAVTPDLAMHGRGWFHWCNGYAGNKLKLVRNSGVGGNTYDQMLARMDADVLAYASDWVFIGGPTNDISNSRTFAQISADATAMLDKASQAGRRVLILTAPPNTGYDTTAKRTVLAQVNAWIAELPQTRPGVIVADAWRRLASPTTGSPATGMANDGVHYSNAGAERVGRAAAAALAPWIVAAPHKASYALDPTAVIANPHLASGTGWVSGGAGMTAAYTVAEDQWASKATLTLTGITDKDERTIEYNENISGGRFAEGSVVQLSARVKWSNIVPVGVSARCAPFLRIRFRNAAGTFIGIQPHWGYTATAEHVVPVGFPASGEMVLTTPKGTVPVGADRVYIAIGWMGAASGTVEISDIAAVKV